MFLQVKAHLSKNWIEKKRNPTVTCCECFSHLVIVCLLLLGYSLSEVFQRKAQDFSTLDISVPPPFIQQQNGGYAGEEITVDPYGAFKFIQNSLKAPIQTPSLDLYLQLANSIQSSFEESSLTRVLSSTAFGRRLDNLLYKGELHFAPRGVLTDSLLKYWNTSVPSIKDFDITTMVHDNEKEAITYVLDNPRTRIISLVILHQVSYYKVNYELRMPYVTLPNTNRIMRRTGTLGVGTEYQTYLTSGFLSIQRAVDEWAFAYSGASPEVSFGAPLTNSSAYYTPVAEGVQRQTDIRCFPPASSSWMFPFTTREYDENPFYAAVGFLLGLGLVMSTLYPMSRLTKSMVEEKETKLREVMKIMGLTDSAHLTSWFITGFWLFFWIAVSVTWVTTMSFIKSSNPIIIFWFFFWFCTSEVTFSILLSTFFSNRYRHHLLLFIPFIFIIAYCLHALHCLDIY